MDDLICTVSVREERTVVRPVRSVAKIGVDVRPHKFAFAGHLEEATEISFADEPLTQGKASVRYERAASEWCATHAPESGLARLAQHSLPRGRADKGLRNSSVPLSSGSI